MSNEENEKLEEELVARIRNNDTEALGEYIELRRPQLSAFVVRNLSDAMKSKIEPADVVSEVAVTAINSLEGMDLSEREPFSWLCHLAERRIIDAHRHFFEAKKRSANKEVGLNSGVSTSKPGGFIDILVASMTTPSAAFSRDQREFKLYCAIDELPEDQRDAVRMRYVDGMATKEIAEKLGKTDGAIRVMLTRTLSRLQKNLEDDSAFNKYQ